MCTHHLQFEKNTVFALLDATATIYFARQFGAASIGERLLIESSVY